MDSPTYPSIHREMSAATIIPFPGTPGSPGVARTVSTRSMKSELIEKASKVVNHPPLLINLVSRRVRQLNQGRAPLINVASYGQRLGQGDVALLEIIEGKIGAESIGQHD